MTHPGKPSNGNGTIRIVIADRHALFRAALRKLLEAETDFAVVGEAENGIEAVARVRDLQPHIVSLDLPLPRCSGLEVLREIPIYSPATQALMLVDAIDEGQLIEAVCLGARGVVFKTTATHLVLKGIRAVNAGEYWLERDRFSLFIRALKNHFGSNGREDFQNLFGLTPRELDIVRAIAAGQSTREMARKIFRSEVTVRHQLTIIFRKLGVRNRGELLNFARSRNLLTEMVHEERRRRG
jgi:DNA-binding NarL/FixJ family response regulator